VGTIINLLDWWRNRAYSNRGVAPSAFCDEHGVSFVDGLSNQEVRHRFMWDEITTVVAFKLDLYSYDEVCVALLNERGEVLGSVSEAGDSFSAFIHDLSRWLEGCRQPDEWWDQVCFPPFQTSLAELYQRCSPRIDSSR
jgi:hypothetical protein